MSSRYNHASSSTSATLHNRDPRASLFSAYTGDRDQPSSQRPSGGVGAGSASPFGGSGAGYPNGGSFRPATPNSRGQYSDAVLSELESQNDQHIEGMTAKVRMLKEITVAIGDEIRDSTALAEKMNNSFDSTRMRLKSTMNRMLRMAERTGIGWKVWLLFFAAVILLFWFVWLF